MSDEKLEVFCDQLSQHPHCAHGPTLLFRKQVGSDVIEEYFACSAYRYLKDCKSYLAKSSFDKGLGKKIFESNIEKVHMAAALKKQLFSVTPEERGYCHTCRIPFIKEDLGRHYDHKFIVGITNDALLTPTKLLWPLENDKTEAQYFFDENTLEFFKNCIQSLSISKVVCMGAPRLHEYLRTHLKELNVESFLLDLDHRFLYFYNNNEFGWYNMCNNYFFEGLSSFNTFKNFLKVEENDSVLLFTDPPFGCRTEPLVHTIKEISATYQRINNFHQILPVFWSFPYYMEIYIKKLMPEMEMIDYKINYTNHYLYHDRENGRKYGSSVRLFTNVPPEIMRLPESEGYKFCKKCKRWTSTENIHCDSCKKCPSKNGETYRHCPLCANCVKPRYEHCIECERCTQRQNHFCLEYQNNLSCGICREKGHLGSQCSKWKDFCNHNKRYRNNHMLARKFVKKGHKMCLICAKIGHHEKRCPKRESILQETRFLNEFVNILNKTGIYDYSM